MNSRLVRFCAAAVAFGGLLAVSISAARVEPTVASWRTDSYANATLSTVQTQPVTAMACNPMSGGGLTTTTIPLTWTQPALTGTGPAPDNYTITVTSGSLTASATTTGTSYNLTTGLLTLGGTYNLTIVANYTNSVGTIVWSSPVSTVRLRIVVGLGLLGIILSYTCTLQANP